MNFTFENTDMGEILPKTRINFSYLNSNELTALSGALNLKMDLGRLFLCQNYFKEKLLPSPCFEELKMIDRVYYDSIKKSGNTLIASLSTNDPIIAETYKDIMSRRNAVSPDYSAPASFNELTELLGKYIRGNESNSALKLHTGKYRFFAAAQSGQAVITDFSLPECGTILCHCSSNITRTAPTSGTEIYALLKSFNDVDSFYEKSSEFLKACDCLSSAKYVSVVENESVISSIYKCFRGFKLYSPLWGNATQSSFGFKRFYDADNGLIFSCAKKELSDILLRAQDFGLRIIKLGITDISGKIHSESTSGEKLSVDIELLRRLNSSVAITCESDMLSTDEVLEKAETCIDINRTPHQFFTVSCENKNYFLSAFNTVLYAYSLALSYGINSFLCAGNYLIKSEDKKTLGSSIELILGAYRAMCELGIYDDSPSVCFNDDIKICFSIGGKSQKIISSTLSEKESYVYYLEPIFNENGLPDFDDLRKMHRYIRALIENGTALCVLPTDNDISKVLNKMCATSCVEYVTKNNIISHIGGFLVQSATPIEGTPIASVGQSTSVFDTAEREICADA